MREIRVHRDVAATQSAVWAVLADFPNIASWNGGVKKSFATSAEIDGVGASRHCDLTPMGGLEETVAEWVPPERMVVNIDSASKLPIRSGRAVFELGSRADVTPTTIRYSYETKFGRLGSMLGPMLDRQLTAGFTGFLEDLELAATSSAPGGRT